MFIYPSSSIRVRPGARLLLLTLVVGTLVGAEWGTLSHMHDYHAAFGLDPERSGDLRVVPLEATAPGTVYHPGEQPRLVIQLHNVGEAPIDAVGSLELIRYALKGVPGDNWWPRVERLELVGSTPLPISLGAGVWTDVEIAPFVPETKGGYALILDLGDHGRHYVTSLVRTFAPRGDHPQYPKQSLEEMPPAILERLDVHAIRWGVGYKPTDSDAFQAHWDAMTAELEELHRHKVTVTAELGTAGMAQPLGRGRPHLDDQDFMQGGKQDMAWLPEHDADAAEFVYRLSAEYGWPKGPITGWMLWNEPWEGRSISGWQADLPRYREIYTAMGEAIFRAREEAGVDVLIGGCDSSSNTWDKLLAEGEDASPLWPAFLDFCSIHYQGMASPALYRSWIERDHHKGRVQIWDTESWVANADDRFATVVATNRAAGYDRAMGTLSRIAVSTMSHGRVAKVTIQTADGEQQVPKLIESRPLAAAYGAVQHFIGEREFDRLLFQQSLPWVYVFDGYGGDHDDGTVVVSGDAMRLFHYRGLLTSVRSLAEVEAKEAIRKHLAALPADAIERRAGFESALAEAMPFSGVTMTVEAAGRPFGLYDFYGNPVPPQDGRLVVPLDERGFFLRADPAVDGSMDALIAAIEAARIDGLQPVELIAADMLRPVDRGASLRLRVTNQLERPIELALDLRIHGLEVDYPETLALAPRERRWVEVPVSGEPRPDNRYPMVLHADAGSDGSAVLREDLHVNWIQKRSVTVDADLADWNGSLAQSIQAGEAGPSFEEQMWLPFVEFGDGAPKGAATGFVAYDDQHFYFAAKIADDSPDGGAPRFATRDDDSYFYPPVAYRRLDPTSSAENVSVRWTGALSVPESGTWTIGARTDDGARLWLDGRQVVDSWVARGPTWDAVEVELEAGRRYPIRFEYYQGGGGSLARLAWHRGDGQWSTIPAANLHPQADDAAGGGLSADYHLGRDFGRIFAQRVDATIDFQWGRRDHLPGVEVEPVIEAHAWPEDVRRFSYRRSPDLPSGYRGKSYDSVLLGFNAIAFEDEPRWITHLPGRMPKFIRYKDIDYEFALNPVAEAFGGGTEVFCLETPAMPRKHFYPRQPTHPEEGAVDDAQLAIAWRDGTRFVECAIPWARVPHVRAKMEAGEPLKFSFKVLHHDGGPEMELATGRSIAEGVATGFHPDWNQSASVELEFGWER